MKSTRRGSFSVHRSEKTPGSKYSSTSGLSPRRFTGRRERGPRGAPGTGRGGGAHREPVVKVGSAPGARPGRGEAGGRGSGIGSWRGWGAVPVVLRGSPLRLDRKSVV